MRPLTKQIGRVLVTLMYETGFTLKVATTLTYARRYGVKTRRVFE